MNPKLVDQIAISVGALLDELGKIESAISATERIQIIRAQLLCKEILHNLRGIQKEAVPSEEQ